jgi:polyisoprenoid-binding protein YceI
VFVIAAFVYPAQDEFELIPNVEARQKTETQNNIFADHSGAGSIAAGRYRLDAAQSRFTIDANSTGLLWFMGHKHHVAAKEFTGEIEATADALTAASLQLTVHTNSLAETGEWFTEQEKQLITNTIHKEVLEVDKYPEASFKTTNVTIKNAGENQFDAKLEGDLNLHGVTRHITIPAKVSLNGDQLLAEGKFEFERDDFKIKTHAIKGGMIRVANDMKISFAIVARKS